MSAARVKVMFIEVTNDNEAFLKNQYKETASTSPDYEGISDKDAVRYIHTYIHTYSNYIHSYFNDSRSCEYIHIDNVYTFISAYILP